MARPLRIEFPGAIYHLMSRGNARQKVFHDDRDYQRLVEGQEAVVLKFGWELMSYVLMPNHLHLFLRTPQPNLSQGMQFLLSGYANWFAKRHARPGHLFQGRFKGELIEDETYFWNVSRYLHLNPLRGRSPLVRHPRDWPWSSYPGYAYPRKRVGWVAYDILLAAWQGQHGGRDPAAAYRRFVQQGIEEPPKNPFSTAVHGWLLGSDQFVRRVRKLSATPKHDDEVPAARRLRSLSLDEVLAAVASYYQLIVDDAEGPPPFADYGRGDVRSAVAAWIARRYTPATRREISTRLGLSHPDSAGNLVRRMEHDRHRNATLRRDLAAIEKRLHTALEATKNQNRV